jgi:multicomponent Na+:H+ antiporter subunit A
MSPALIIFFMALSMDWTSLNWPKFEGATLLAGAICLLISISAIATALFPQRLSAILALGTMGYAMAGLYIVMKAPDLALTQIMIESASIILFLLAFRYLPQLKIIPQSRSRCVRDWIIAIFLGITTSAGMALAMNTHNFRTIADYFMRTSKPVAGFNNVVNAIIVDYRAYDTLGEIAVLVISGIAIYAMLRLVNTMQHEEEGN